MPHAPKTNAELYEHYQQEWPQILAALPRDLPHLFNGDLGQPPKGDIEKYSRAMQGIEQDPKTAAIACIAFRMGVAVVNEYLAELRRHGLQNSPKGRKKAQTEVMIRDELSKNPKIKSLALAKRVAREQGYSIKYVENELIPNVRRALESENGKHPET